MAERRRHERIAFTTSVVLLELDSGDCPMGEFPGEAVDISRSGLGVRSRRMYHVGRKVLIMLVIPGHESRYKCGFVRSSRYAGAGQYHVGVEFCETPCAARLSAWITGQRMGKTP